jgi:hypothetical protein
MNVRTLGIDLAKNVFSVHGVDDRGKTSYTARCVVVSCYRLSHSCHPVW